MNQQKLKSNFYNFKKLHDLSLNFKKDYNDWNSSANRPEDYWSQIYFLDQGKALGKSFKSFYSKLNSVINYLRIVMKEHNLKII